ncbi:helix-turn-helix domain-containing protein [Moorena bouillonii]|uniref:helix-turn-helix domain-containing protein n=2 Tax=Moorena TaxID=1155738 RepID=UPI003F6A34B4
MVKEIEVQASSGNVFADLGLENSDELIVKAELARKISSIIANQGMTQAAAAKVLGVDQPKVSALINGKLAGFSIVQLFRFVKYPSLLSCSRSVGFAEAGASNLNSTRDGLIRQ